MGIEVPSLGVPIKSMFFFWTLSTIDYANCFRELDLTPFQEFPIVDLNCWKLREAADQRGTSQFSPPVSSAIRRPTWGLSGERGLWVGDCEHSIFWLNPMFGACSFQIRELLYCIYIYYIYIYNCGLLSTML